MDAAMEEYKEAEGLITTMYNILDISDSYVNGVSYSRSRKQIEDDNKPVQSLRTNPLIFSLARICCRS
jgi:hypothetical protein